MSALEGAKDSLQGPIATCDIEHVWRGPGSQSSRPGTELTPKVHHLCYIRMIRKSPAKLADILLGDLDTL
jgi:hypothetical protein